MKHLLCAVMAALTVSVGVAAAADLHLRPGELVAEPSFEACSYYFVAPPRAEKPFAVEFRPAGAESWQRAFAPVSDTPAGVWKGSVVDLPEDSAGEIRVVDSAGREVIAPVAFRTWTSRPKIAKTIDLSTVTGADKGLVITDQGSPDGWIKYTAPAGWQIRRPYDLNDAQRGAITVRHARYVILENLTVIGGSRYGIQVELSDAIRVLNCDISGWGRVGEQQYTNTSTRGKYLDANGDVINLDGGVEIDRSAHTVIERCYVHDPRGRANSWQYSHPAGPSAVHVNTSPGGTVIRWNDFIGSDEHRWNDVIEASSNSAADGGLGRDSDVSGNFLAFGNDDGVELEGGGMNVRYYRNQVEGTTCGISTGACLLGPQFVFGNLVANEGDETGLALMLFKNSHGVPQAGKRHFINNTLFTVSSAPYGNYGNPAGLERIGYMRNNVFFASSARVPDEKMRRDDFDGDLFWNDRSSAASEQFLARLHQIGQEPHGIAADPRFVAPEQGDFHLQPDSPATGRALPVPNFAPAGANRGAFAQADTEVPYRPLALTATPRQLEFADTGAAEIEVRVTVPQTATTPQPFEIRQNQVFTWFKVTPASGVVAPGGAVTLKVAIDRTQLRGRPRFKGAFLVRTPTGLSRPVTVYATTPFLEDLRPAEASNTVYVVAAALPAFATLTGTTDDTGAFDRRYVELPDQGRPELTATVDVCQSGRFALLVRAGNVVGAMNRRDFEVSIDDGKPLRTSVTPDYNWNTDNGRFRAVYIGDLGEMKAGRHELRLAVKGGLKLNEVILTTTPAPFMADGRQRSLSGR